MKKVVSIYKPITFTPLQAIDQFRKENSQYKNAKLGYAGRLDPMAEGLLLVLVDEENKKRKEYERLPKEYEFQILFGFSTDTYDVMGMVMQAQDIKDQMLDLNEVQKAANTFVRKFKQPYPPYSSARVKGKPLYYWAREDKLREIIIPEKEVEIFAFEVSKVSSVTGKDLSEEIKGRIKKVKGEFRQQKIVTNWEKILNKHKNKDYFYITCKVRCSSGTYMRSLAFEIGKLLNIPTLALSIKRTKIGEFRVF